MEGGKKQLL